jgi:exopolysaccharide biosynthesis polyprenyl glycosylphosphotransferase
VSTRAHDRPVDSPPLREVVDPWAATAGLTARVGQASVVTEVGRAVLVWVPAFMLTAEHYGSTGSAVAVASIIACIWTLTLRSAAEAVHFALGSAVRSAVGTMTGLVAVSALMVWLPGMSLPSATLAAMAVSIFALSTAWEAVCRRVAMKRRVLVVGAGRGADAVMKGVLGEPHTPFAVVGVVHDRTEAVAPVEGSPVLGPVADLAAIVEAQRPELIVLADGESSAQALDRLLGVASRRFKVVGLTHFFEHAFGRVPLEDLTPAWFMSILHLRQKPYTRVAKRSFDVTGAVFGLLVAAPVMVVIALLLRTTGGPVIYRQTRVGEGGRPFTMYKFRTMVVGAEESGRPIFAAKHDPRVTRLGRFLRTTHLDELPQLWDVLKGDMSIVGPRPERPEFAPMLEQAVPYFSRRLLIKPGVTGWAQLRCDYASDADGAATKVSYDLWYLRHRNLLVDVAICAKTFTSVILRPGR